MKKITKSLFKELQVLNFIKYHKYDKNYSKSKRYRYITDKAYKEYLRYL